MNNIILITSDTIRQWFATSENHYLTSGQQSQAIHHFISYALIYV